MSGHLAWWEDLTAEQREIHYNRVRPCNHEYVYPMPDDQRLREAYSFDPYFHTAHMEPCTRLSNPFELCECQMCVLKIGIPITSRFKEDRP